MKRFSVFILSVFVSASLPANAATLEAAGLFFPFGFEITFSDDNRNGLLDIDEVDRYVNDADFIPVPPVIGTLIAIPEIENISNFGALPGYEAYADGLNWAALYPDGSVGRFAKSSYTYTLSDLDAVAPVPLPPAALLFGTVLAGAGFWRRRRKTVTA